MDTRSLAYYFHYVLLNDSQYQAHVRHVKDEIRALSRDPDQDSCYLGFLRMQLRELGEMEE